MTVAEFVAKLEKLPQHLEVYVYNPDTDDELPVGEIQDKDHSIIIHPEE